MTAIAEEYTVSTLIKILEKVREKDGDIPVRLFNSEYGMTMYMIDVGTMYETPGMRVAYDEDSEENTKVFYITYC